MDSAQTRHWTSVPCIARWILNHWTTKEAQVTFFKHPQTYSFEMNCKGGIITNILYIVTNEVILCFQKENLKLSVASMPSKAIVHIVYCLKKRTLYPVVREICQLGIIEDFCGSFLVTKLTCFSQPSKAPSFFLRWLIHWCLSYCSLGIGVIPKRMVSWLRQQLWWW